METNANQYRDYSSISSSAKALLFLKGLTSIPYAGRAAALMSRPEPYDTNPQGQNLQFWGRVMHFESRYWSIDQLLQDIDARQILELSSGFSFRGLATVAKEDVHYVDTDLEGVVQSKQSFVKDLSADDAPSKGKLEFAPLNAVNSEAFGEIINRFDPQLPLVIVNEGLLMYLGDEEKQQLCRSVRKALQRHGGYWITADIYNNKEIGNRELVAEDKLGKFFHEHNIVSNMFENFDAAKLFFEQQGFVVDKEAETDYSMLTAMPRIMQLITPEMKGATPPEFQVTWRLKLAD